MMKFKEVILLKYGELILKGLNKSRFENQLLNDLAKKLKKVGEYKITKAQSTVYVFPQDEEASEDIGKAYAECKKVFGIVALCRACEVERIWIPSLQHFLNISDPEWRKAEHSRSKPNVQINTSPLNPRKYPDFAEVLYFQDFLT